MTEPVGNRNSKFLSRNSSKRRVTPDECGFASSDGNPGTNGATSKTRCGTGINTSTPALQAPILPSQFPQSPSEKSSRGRLERESLHGERTPPPPRSGHVVNFDE